MRTVRVYQHPNDKVEIINDGWKVDGNAEVGVYSEDLAVHIILGENLEISVWNVDENGDLVDEKMSVSIPHKKELNENP